MASSKALKGRIRSVTNTRKITRTMEMVATSKLKRAQDRVIAARPYAEALREVIADLVTPELAEQFPLLRQPLPPSKGGPSRAVLILLTSNRGLAGGFNANLIKEARRRIAALEAEGYDVELVGRRQEGRRLLQVRRTADCQRAPRHWRSPDGRARGSLVEALIEEFAAGTLGVVELVQSQFMSVLDSPPVAVRILPVEPPGRAPSRRAARLHPLARPGDAPRGGAAAVRAEHGVSRARRDRGGRAGRAADRHEERHRQRGRHHRRARSGRTTASVRRRSRRRSPNWWVAPRHCRDRREARSEKRERGDRLLVGIAASHSPLASRLSLLETSTKLSEWEDHDRNSTCFHFRHHRPGHRSRARRRVHAGPAARDLQRAGDRGRERARLQCGWSPRCSSTSVATRCAPSR